MFGLPTEQVESDDTEEQQQQQNGHHEPSPAANGAPLKEKWCVALPSPPPLVGDLGLHFGQLMRSSSLVFGYRRGDSQVGHHNNGVNGSANNLAAKIGLAVELGSGFVSMSEKVSRARS